LLNARRIGNVKLVHLSRFFVVFCFIEKRSAMSAADLALIALEEAAFEGRAGERQRG